VPGGFLCGIPNIENLDKTAGTLCVFSKIQLSPKSELHTAIVIRQNLDALLSRLRVMATMPGDFFADKNNNCALFLWSDGNLYPYNKAKVTFELTPDMLSKLGSGVEPDMLYWAIYGNEKDAEGGAVAQLAGLIGRAKFKRLPALNVPELKFASPPPSESLGSISSEFRENCNSVEYITPTNLVQRYTSSLLAKRFLILTGLSGSGKTKLAQAFARWLTPEPLSIDTTDEAKGKNPNTYYKVVSVGADWSGNENILGYPNGLHPEEYFTKPALELILHAASEDHKDDPHFLILDEMNLSHVERYFADILSAIESDEKIQLHRDEKRTAGAGDIEPEIELPKNLFIIGTVNIDETTHMFSPKVLDRANVIEFRMEETELASFLENPVKPDLNNLDGKGKEYGKSFVVAAKNPADLPEDAKLRFQCEMLLFFKVLQEYGAEFGYRVTHEAGRFVNFYKALGGETDLGIWFKEAFDCIIVQKFLPKLHGSESKLRGVLFSLAYLCADKREWTGSKLEENRERIGKLVDDAKKKADSSENSPVKLKEKLKADGKAVYYPLSFEKIERMWRAAHDNGFASFAES